MGGNDVATHLLRSASSPAPIRARFVRLYPIDCALGSVDLSDDAVPMGEARPAIRMELYGRYRYVFNGDVGAESKTSVPAEATPVVSASSVVPNDGSHPVISEPEGREETEAQEADEGGEGS